MVTELWDVVYSIWKCWYLGVNFACMMKSDQLGIRTNYFYKLSVVDRDRTLLKTDLIIKNPAKNEKTDSL